MKRNAREAVDPKLVFQTMRPVFNDLVTEVQRSIGFFRSIDKKAEIADMVVTGNTVKMPGLAAYIGKNLGFDVQVIDRFNRLTGDEVLGIPTFRDNAPTFAVCYGLCLQGLGISQVHASLVPREIMTARLIRAKKPWTLAGLTALLIGMSGHYALSERSWATTLDEIWSNPIRQVESMSSHRDTHVETDGKLVSQLTYINEMGKQVSGNAERRLKWLEILRAINGAIPRTDYVDNKIPSPKELPLEERKDIHVKQCDSKFYEDLSTWWSDDVAKRYREEIRNWARITNNPVPEDLATDPGPSGPGWVFELRCYHDYNSPKNIGYEGNNHVRNVMTSAYLNNSVEVPVGTDANGKVITETFSFEEMGLSYPLLLNVASTKKITVDNPDFDLIAAQEAMIAGETPQEGEDVDPVTLPVLPVDRMDFTYQIVWQEKPLSERIETRKAAEEAGGQADPNTVAVAE